MLIPSYVYNTFDGTNNLISFLLFVFYGLIVKWLSGFVTSKFKDVTGGYGGLSSPSEGTGRRGCACAFTIIFALSLNNFLSEALSSILSISSLK